MNPITVPMQAKMLTNASDDKKTQANVQHVKTVRKIENI